MNSKTFCPHFILSFISLNAYSYSLFVALLNNILPDDLAVGGYLGYFHLFYFFLLLNNMVLNILIDA